MTSSTYRRRQWPLAVAGACPKHVILGFLTATCQLVSALVHNSDIRAHARTLLRLGLAESRLRSTIVLMLLSSCRRLTISGKHFQMARSVTQVVTVCWQVRLYHRSLSSSVLPMCTIDVHKRAFSFNWLVHGWQPIDRQIREAIITYASGRAPDSLRIELANRCLVIVSSLSGNLPSPNTSLQLALHLLATERIN